MNLFLRLFSLAVALCVLATTPAFADDDEPASNMPEAVENAITLLFDNCKKAQSATIEQAPLDAIMQHADQMWQKKSQKNVLPKKRSDGAGAFYQDTIKLPFAMLVGYIANPNIPSAAIYPATVRCNEWLTTGNFTQNWQKLSSTTSPSTANIVLYGAEKEETTPDTSSGCTFRYTLNRLFILTQYNNRPALISVSYMPKESEYGHKGVLVDDKTWSYVYTDTIGTNLMLAGWAKTNLYGSATVTLCTENDDKQSVTMTLYKYTKAGWSGMNMVKHNHIIAGLKRFVNNFKELVENPRCPKPEAMAQTATELEKLDKEALIQRILPFIESLKNSKESLLKKSPFAETLADYPNKLTKETALAEALRVALREQLGISLK